MNSTIEYKNETIELSTDKAVVLYKYYHENPIDRNVHKYIKFIRYNNDRILTCYCDFLCIKLTIEFRISKKQKAEIKALW